MAESILKRFLESPQGKKLAQEERRATITAREATHATLVAALASAPAEGARLQTIFDAAYGDVLSTQRELRAKQERAAAAMADLTACSTQQERTVQACERTLREGADPAIAVLLQEIAEWRRGERGLPGVLPHGDALRAVPLPAEHDVRALRLRDARFIAEIERVRSALLALQLEPGDTWEQLQVIRAAFVALGNGRLAGYGEPGLALAS